MSLSSTLEEYFICRKCNDRLERSNTYPSVWQGLRDPSKRKLICRRWESKCDWCGRSPLEVDLQVDHSIPVIRGKGRSGSGPLFLVKEYESGIELRLLSIQCHHIPHALKRDEELRKTAEKAKIHKPRLMEYESMLYA